jgi:hypothetical protein
MPLWVMENSSSISLINMGLIFDLTGMMNSNIGAPSVKLYFVCKLRYWPNVHNIQERFFEQKGIDGILYIVVSRDIYLRMR